MLLNNFALELYFILHSKTRGLKDDAVEAVFF